MLVYHPFNDTYHCLFRLILLIDHLPIEIYEIEKLKILSFYLIFPNQLKKIKLPMELRIFRNYINSIQDPYSMMIDTKRILDYLDNQVDYSLRYMASSSMIEIELLKNGKVKKYDVSLYRKFITNKTVFDKDLLDFLVRVLSKIPLNGINGLKARTNLYEYRYDNE